MTDPVVELNEALLQKAAGSTSYVRGEDYVRCVHGLEVGRSTARASIQARSVYLVELDWSQELRGTCTCPHWAKGNFCKHLVALGLAVLDRPGPPASPSAVEPWRNWVEGLGIDEARALVVELAERHPEVERLLQVRAATRTATSDVAAAELTAMVQDALRTRGFVDYRRSFDVAADARDVLDELTTHLDAGAADVVRPALLKALTRLRTITQHADDSAGVLGDACQVAADLYARACREGSPDPVKLARWLVKFRDESPGWPMTPLAAFAPAFDEKAVAAYRKAVAVLDDKYAGADRYRRDDVDEMLLELADHDDDVDEAVRILSRDEHPDYGGIVDRLRAAGRDDEAFGWIERAVAHGRVSARGGRGAYWLDPEDVAAAYVARGRIEDALEVQRREFASSPTVRRFTILLDLVREVGRSVEAERGRCFATLEEQARAPYGSGAARIQIAIAERDLATAWEVAQELGAGHAWQELAGALAAEHPGRAAELWQPRIDESLKRANSAVYPEVARQLALVRDLCARAGESEDFGLYLDALRARYARRPALMAALARQGL